MKRREKERDENEKGGGGGRGNVRDGERVGVRIEREGKRE